MSQHVPSFFVYGEPDRPLDVGFLHVETVMERRNVHSGRVSAHKHDRMAQITFWTCGEGEYFIEDTRLHFVAPAISFVPSGTVHGFTVAPDTTDAIVVSVADSALPPLRALSTLGFALPVMVRGQKDNALWQHLHITMKRLLDDYRGGNFAALAALIAVATNDIASLARNDSVPGHSASRLAQAFRELVDRHFRENWPVERYTETLATTPHLLAKACHEAYGQPAKALIDDRRLLEAKRLLLFTVRPVEDIAYETGFRDPAYFSRFFRRRTGSPPGEWRIQQAERT